MKVILPHQQAQLSEVVMKITLWIPVNRRNIDLILRSHCWILSLCKIKYFKVEYIVKTPKIGYKRACITWNHIFHSTCIHCWANDYSLCFFLCPQKIYQWYLIIFPFNVQAVMSSLEKLVYNALETATGSFVLLHARGSFRAQKWAHPLPVKKKRRLISAKSR